MKITTIILIQFFLFTPTKSYAVEDDAILCKPKVFLFYSNGINNSIREAQKSLDELKKTILLRIGPEKTSWDPTESDIAYNFDSPLIFKLLEIYEQKKDEKDGIEREKYETLNNLWEWNFDLTNAPEWFREIVIDNFQKKSKENYGQNTKETSAYFSNPSVNLDIYEILLVVNRMILTVAHSQGNLLTNSLYNTLLQNEDYVGGGLAMISVATPASFVSLDGPYLTLESDGYINLLRKYSSALGIVPPLQPNARNTFPTPGKWDHNFISHYLEGKDTGERLINNVIQQMKKLEKDNELPKIETVPAECIEAFEVSKKILQNVAPPEHGFEHGSCFAHCLTSIDIYDPELAKCRNYCNTLCDCNVLRWKMIFDKIY